uniref:Uncharacterized protein n=1 Tax=Palpitomonas bilix TaxID=652834 RepID=A0A7S3FZX7_9EUKA|mmetsp:Transcript_17458/g.43527  ORF Transcript_17458/g.43527 Transcript_17458/m.43527 type:complete len:283 (+) Transcript_17458:71-919(+)
MSTTPSHYSARSTGSARSSPFNKRSSGSGSKPASPSSASRKRGDGNTAMEEKLGDEIERAISAAGSRLDFAFEDTASDGRKPEMTEEDLQVELEDRARDIVLDTMKAERLEKWKQLEEKISKLAPSPNRGGDSNKMFADSLSPLRDAMEERSMGSMGSPRRARRGKSFAPQPQSGKKRSGSIDAEQLEELFQKGKEELAGLWHSSKFKTALANVRHMSEEEERQKEREKKEEEERKRQIVEREVAWKTVLRRMRRYTTIACLPKLCPSGMSVILLLSFYFSC